MHPKEGGETRPFLEKNFSTFRVTRALLVARNEAFPDKNFHRVDGTVIGLVKFAKKKEKEAAGSLWESQQPEGIKRFTEFGLDLEQVMGILEQLTRMSKEAHGDEQVADTSFRTDETLEPRIAQAFRNSMITPDVIKRAEAILYYGNNEQTH
jgi:hypothetical protein